MFRYKLRTMLILMAIAPPAGAGGYRVWERSRPSPWFIQDSMSPPYLLPPNTPGYRWKLTRGTGFIEVPEDSIADSPVHVGEKSLTGGP